MFRYRHRGREFHEGEQRYIKRAKYRELEVIHRAGLVIVAHQRHGSVSRHVARLYPATTFRLPNHYLMRITLRPG